MSVVTGKRGKLCQTVCFERFTVHGSWCNFSSQLVWALKINLCLNSVCYDLMSGRKHTDCNCGSTSYCTCHIGTIIREQCYIIRSLNIWKICKSTDRLEFTSFCSSCGVSILPSLFHLLKLCTSSTWEHTFLDSFESLNHTKAIKKG